MKTKLISLLAALLGLSINVASAEAPSLTGNAGTKYTSDYNRRGELLSAEAIQAQIGFNAPIAGVDVFGDFFTNQSTESDGLNTDEFTLGINTSLLENTFEAYLGIYNTDSDGSDATLEAFVSLGANVPLSPTVSVYRDTEDDLYTFEGQLSYDVDLDLFALQLAGVLGNTDATALEDRTYYGAKLTATKTLGENINLYADVALSDANDREDEALWGIGVSVTF